MRLELKGINNGGGRPLGAFLPMNSKEVDDNVGSH